MVQAALRATPGLSTYLLSPRRSALTRAAGLWSEAAVGADAAQDLARRLRPAVTEADEAGASMLLVVERTQDFENTAAEDEIAELVREFVNSEQAVIGEADVTFFNSNYGLPGAFKASRSGVSLQPSGDESTAFSSDYRGVSRDQLLEGRGYIVRRGNPELMQVAMPISQPEGVGLRPSETLAAQSMG
jgi:S-DNA-T family DNA segregation ATPase FtsK/SpoIIIE